MFPQDLDIEKKMTLRKYSNFRCEVGNASVGDPSMIHACQWEISKLESTDLIKLSKLDVSA
jgi:hypothetical protein